MSTPALTAEERARDVTALLMKRLPGTGISIVMADRDDAHAQIASAIREAEDVAYERACREIALTTIANIEGRSWDFINGLELAGERIRSLKSQEP